MALVTHPCIVFMKEPTSGQTSVILTNCLRKRQVLSEAPGSPAAQLVETCNVLTHGLVAGQRSSQSRLQCAGLDARAAAIVMRAVKNTVRTGRTVVCTIHQPSLEIFQVRLLHVRPNVECHREARLHEEPGVFSSLNGVGFFFFFFFFPTCLMSQLLYIARCMGVLMLYLAVELTLAVGCGVHAPASMPTLASVCIPCAKHALSYSHSSPSGKLTAEKCLACIQDHHGMLQQGSHLEVSPQTRGPSGLALHTETQATADSKRWLWPAAVACSSSQTLRFDCSMTKPVCRLLMSCCCCNVEDTRCTVEKWGRTPGL